MAAGDRPLAVLLDSSMGARDFHVGDVDGASLASEFVLSIDHYRVGALLGAMIAAARHYEVAILHAFLAAELLASVTVSEVAVAAEQTVALTAKTGLRCVSAVYTAKDVPSASAGALLV